MADKPTDIEPEVEPAAPVVPAGPGPADAIVVVASQEADK